MRLHWKNLFIPNSTASLIVEKGIDAAIAEPLLAFVDAIKHEPNSIYLPLTPKVINGRRVFTHGFGSKTRLVFIESEINGVKGLLLEQAMFKHEYSKLSAVQWNPDELTTYPLSVDTGTTIQTQQGAQAIADDSKALLEGKNKLIPMILSEEQVAIATVNYEKSKIVIGTAGAGKTLSAKLQLQEMIGESIGENKSDLVTLVYVAHSEKLRLQMKQELEDWARLNQFALTCAFRVFTDRKEIPVGVKVCILLLSPEELQKDIAYSSEVDAKVVYGVELAVKEDVIAIITELLKENKYQELRFTPEVVYQDFMRHAPELLGGQKAYEKLGDRHSLGVCHAKKACALFCDLNAQLKKNQLIYFPFRYFKNKNKPYLYDLITIDEAQLLSVQQMLTFESASKTYSFYMDLLQRWLTNQALVTRFKQHLSSKNITFPEVIVLPQNYRSPPSLIAGLNAISALITHLDGGAQDEFVSPCMSVPDHAKDYVSEKSLSYFEGDLLDKTNQRYREVYNSYQESPDYCVVVFSEADREYAKVLFPGLIQCFLWHEVQGLEYEHVMLFNVFGHAENWKPISNFIEKKMLSADDLCAKRNAPKSGEEVVSADAVVSLRVAMTRSYKKLTMLQVDQISHVCSKSRDFIFQAFKDAVTPDVHGQGKFDADGWKLRASKLYNAGLVEAAINCLKNYVAMDEVGAKAFLGVAQFKKNNTGNEKTISASLAQHQSKAKPQKKSNVVSRAIVTSANDDDEPIDVKASAKSGVGGAIAVVDSASKAEVAKYIFSPNHALEMRFVLAADELVKYLFNERYVLPNGHDLMVRKINSLSKMSLHNIYKMIFEYRLLKDPIAIRMSEQSEAMLCREYFNLTDPVGMHRLMFAKIENYTDFMKFCCLKGAASIFTMRAKIKNALSGYVSSCFQDIFVRDSEPRNPTQMLLVNIYWVFYLSSGLKYEPKTAIKMLMVSLMSFYKNLDSIASPDSEFRFHDFLFYLLVNIFISPESIRVERTYPFFEEPYSRDEYAALEEMNRDASFERYSAILTRWIFQGYDVDGKFQYNITRLYRACVNDVVAINILPFVNLSPDVIPDLSLSVIFDDPANDFIASLICFGVEGIDIFLSVMKKQIDDFSKFRQLKCSDFLIPASAAYHFLYLKDFVSNIDFSRYVVEGDQYNLLKASWVFGGNGKALVALIYSVADEDLKAMIDALRNNAPAIAVNDDQDQAEMLPLLQGPLLFFNQHAVKKSKGVEPLQLSATVDLS